MQERETWMGVGLVYPKASQARSKGRDKLSSMNELAWKDAPSEGAKNDFFVSPALLTSSSSSAAL